MNISSHCSDLCGYNTCVAKFFEAFKKLFLWNVKCLNCEGSLSVHVNRF